MGSRREYNKLSAGRYWRTYILTVKVVTSAISATYTVEPVEGNVHWRRTQNRYWWPFSLVVRLLTTGVLIPEHSDNDKTALNSFNTTRRGRVSFEPLSPAVDPAPQIERACYCLHYTVHIFYPRSYVSTTLKIPLILMNGFKFSPFLYNRPNSRFLTLMNKDNTYY